LRRLAPAKNWTGAGSSWLRRRPVTLKEGYL